MSEPVSGPFVPDDLPPSSSCRSCGAAIIWAKTIKGVSIPLDEQPSLRGNIVLAEGTALVYRDPSAVAPRYANQPRYLTHFATCPNAETHRRER